METTWEQVDITALGPNSYLRLKNKATIRILIHTPCVRRIRLQAGDRLEP